MILVQPFTITKRSSLNGVEIVMGETIIMPAGKPHALQAVKRFKMMLVMVKS